MTCPACGCTYVELVPGTCYVCAGTGVPRDSRKHDPVGALAGALGVRELLTMQYAGLSAPSSAVRHNPGSP